MFVLIKLKSIASKYFYIKKKNKKKNKKILIKKFDPIIRKRVFFKEEKL